MLLPRKFKLPPPITKVNHCVTDYELKDQSMHLTPPHSSSVLTIEVILSVVTASETASNFVRGRVGIVTKCPKLFLIRGSLSVIAKDTSSNCSMTKSP